MKVADPAPIRLSQPKAECTCPTAWFGIQPPPACPIHGEGQIAEIRCR